MIEDIVYCKHISSLLSLDLMCILTHRLLPLSLFKNQWFLGVGLTFFLGFVVMLIYGIYLCASPSDIDYICPGARCNTIAIYDDDNPAASSSVYWGPCGKGYSDSSTNSTCDQYCGDQNGVVCALQQSTGYSTSIYCGKAIKCADPVALSLLIVGSVMVGFTLLCSCLGLIFHWNKTFEDRLLRDVMNLTNIIHQERNQGREESIETPPLATANWTMDTDTESVSRAIPVAHKTNIITTDDLPVVKLSG